MKMFKTLMVMGVLAFGAGSASAATTGVVFEFDGAGGADSTLTASTDGSVVGTGINIDSIFVTDIDGVRSKYAVDSGILSFDTADGEDGFLSIVGSVDSIFGTGNNEINLFTGTVSGAFDVVNGFNVFTGTGGGNVNTDILDTLDISTTASGFSYYAFTLGIDDVGIITADITATQNGDRTTVVPVPAAAWLFGTGLLGLVGVARRKA